jgi:hypothetical protein
MQQPQDGRIYQAVSGQWLGKDIPKATDMNTTIEELCFLWFVLRCYKQRTRFELSQICMGVCEEGTWAGGWGIAVVWSRYQETSNNRLRTLDCVLQLTIFIGCVLLCVPIRLTVNTTNILAFNLLQLDFLFLLHVSAGQDLHQAAIYRNRYSHWTTDMDPYWCDLSYCILTWNFLPQVGVYSSIPDEVIGFFYWPNPSSRTMALGSTQPLTEMSTRNLPGGKGRSARKADNITAICEPIV